MKRSEPLQAPGAFIVVTGLSGSGKSLVHRCFEDMGYFCVDNLPIELIPNFTEMRNRGGTALGRVALTVDAREREFLAEFPAVLRQLRQRHPEVSLLFLEAEDAVLLKRFSETRRPHPLAGEGQTVLEGITAERALLASLREEADVIVDTTDQTVHELRRWLVDRWTGAGLDARLQVAIVSFGFRHGVPKQADLVFDVRFLPNPFFDEALRPLSGRDAAVRDFLRERAEYREFMSRLTDMLDFLLPHYEKEGKTYLTIAVGCTGGRHRSVGVTEDLHERLEVRGVRTIKSHRDCDRIAS